MPWYGALPDTTLWYGGAVIKQANVKSVEYDLTDIGATKTVETIVDADIKAGDVIQITPIDMIATFELLDVAVTDGQIVLTFTSRTNTAGESLAYSVFRAVAD
jgi:hypothetical protein